jgi:hypothetical protein
MGKLARSVIAALTGPAGAEDGDGCCRLSPTPEGFRKLDSWSGVVSERKRGPNSNQCRLVPDEQAALQAEIDRLAKENAALARISHKFCDAKAIFGKKLICRKGLASVRRVHPFRQSVFRP